MGKTVRMSQRPSKSPYAAKKRLRSSAQQSDEVIYQRVQPRDVPAQLGNGSSNVAGQPTSTQVSAQMTPELRNEVIQTVNALIHSPATVTSPDSINESQQLNTDESSSQQELNSIWVVGSSIVKHAFIEAKRSFDGCSLGLHRKSYRVWWQGKGGMKWGELVPRIKFLLQIESPPKILVIHCGGNSIGAISLFDFRETLRSDIMKLHEMLPQTTRGSQEPESLT
ncbi:uncharacterized protein [Mytilus edulis]|uniref:uncharacterized protein n=2 Tax=Mytilus edulis TaxID=6550 RepID=UPI0039EF4F38